MAGVVFIVDAPIKGFKGDVTTMGCKPVRTSRSDKHNNPRTYFAPIRTQQPPMLPKNVGGNPLNYAKAATSAVSNTNQ